MEIMMNELKKTRTGGKIRNEIDGRRTEKTFVHLW